MTIFNGGFRKLKVHQNNLFDAIVQLYEEKETVFSSKQRTNFLTLSLDDGTELECAIIRTFPAGDKNYIALLPIADIDEEESEVYLYRFSLDSNNEPVLENIDSDEEYEIVSDAFDEELDAMEYEELYEQEDSENE